MSKKRILEKRNFTLEELQPIKIVDDSGTIKEKASLFFKDHTTVADALLQALIDNDTDAFMEILDSYLRVNRTKISKKAEMPRSTISLAFSKKGNPTLKTIAKIVHETVSSNKRN